jgi:pimeloyl-ACP methyl ester carboxylesterase
MDIEHGASGSGSGRTGIPTTDPAEERNDMTTPNVVGRYFDVQGGQVYAHVREGDGPALVFLHYWGGSRRTWIPVLQRLGPEQAFVAYDQRGWGDSVAVPGPYGIEQLADDAQKVIDGLGYTNYVLVGHSMGGKVTQTLAARRPSGLRGAVLVAPAPPAPVGVTAQLQQLTSHAYDSEDTVHESIDLMLTHGGLTPELRQQVVEDSLRAGDEARLAWPRHGLVQDVSPGVGNIDVPVLVLAGSHDKVDPVAVLTDHLLPLIPTASMSVLDGTGHLSPLEVPDRVATHINKFIAQL